MKPERIIGLASLLIIPYTAVKTQSLPPQTNSRPNATRNANGTANAGRFSQQTPVRDRMGNSTVQMALHEQKLNYTLTGESLTISGNNNELLVRGKCNKLTITGSGNIVYVETVAGINTVGHRNEVIWRSGNPSVSNMGNGNNIVSRE